jgi:hypothetical protein
LLNIGGTDAGISRLGAASLAIGNGTAGDFTGALKLGAVHVATATSIFGASQIDITASNSGGRAYLSLVNDLGNSFGLECTGSTGAALPNSTFIFTSDVGTAQTQLAFCTNGQLSSGGTTPISFLAGGFGITPQLKILATGALQIGGSDTGISRLGAASLAIGNGTAGDTTGNLSFNRVSLAGADYAGQATVTAAATTKAVTFAANYTGTAQPVIVLTPTSDPLATGVPVGYWVTYSGGAGAWTGFTVNIQTALAGNVTFNYIVIGKA